MSKREIEIYKKCNRPREDEKTANDEYERLEYKKPTIK